MDPCKHSSHRKVLVNTHQGQNTAPQDWIIYLRVIKRLLISRTSHKYDYQLCLYKCAHILKFPLRIRIYLQWWVLCLVILFNNICKHNLVHERQNLFNLFTTILNRSEQYYNHCLILRSEIILWKFTAFFLFTHRHINSHYMQACGTLQPYWSQWSTM